jgi:hypothetical protein
MATATMLLHVVPQRGKLDDGKLYDQFAAQTFCDGSRGFCEDFALSLTE